MGEGEGELCLYGNENGETWEIDISDELDKAFMEAESEFNEEFLEEICFEVGLQFSMRVRYCLRMTLVLKY